MGFPFSKANFKALIGSIWADTPTIKSGKIKRIPRTAIKTPKVKKAFCHAELIRSRIRAFTIALSIDKEISRTARISVIKSPFHPA